MPLEPQGPSERRAKEWPRRFKQRGEEHPDQDGSWVELRKTKDPDEAEIDTFLRDCDEIWHSCKYKVVRQFVESARQSTSQRRRNEATATWMNDHEYATERTREYPNRMTPSEFLASLQVPRFNSSDFPDGDRRLIYIANLDSDSILALAVTATFPQVAVLRDMFWKHIAFQTAFNVILPTKGFLVFRLEFHMPYFALRESSTKVCGLQTGECEPPLRKWKDLSFLRDPSSTETGTFGVHEAQVSIVVTGPDCTRWIAYAFVDTAFNDLYRNDSDDTDDDDDNDQEDGEGDMGVKPDPIHSDRGSEIDATRPVWCPREYFLTNVNSRMKQVLFEWTDLIHRVEKSFNQHKAQHSFILNDRSLEKQADGITQAFYWTCQVIETLQQFQDCFSRMMRAWRRFERPNGDISYFSDLCEPRVTRLLDEIGETFESLEDLEQMLRRLDSACEKWYKILELRICFDSNQLNLQSNQLNYQSNRLQLESHDLNRESLSLNLETSRISLETKKVTLANHGIARDASSMNQIWIPLGIVVAYFGTQQEIFHFDRNPRTFFLCFFVVLIGVQLWISLPRFIYRMVSQTKWFNDFLRWVSAYRLVRFFFLRDSKEIFDVSPPGEPQILEPGLEQNQVGVNYQLDV